VLLGSFKRREELIARGFNQSIVSENAPLSRIMLQSPIFEEEQELQLFTYNLSQVDKEHSRGTIEL
jgi:hypothetical protein